MKLSDEVSDNLPLFAVTGENDSLDSIRLVRQRRTVC